MRLKIKMTGRQKKNKPVKPLFRFFCWLFLCEKKKEQQNLFGNRLLSYSRKRHTLLRPLLCWFFWLCPFLIPHHESIRDSVLMELEGLYIHRRLFTLALHTPKIYFLLFFFDYFPYTRTKRKKHFFDYSGGTGFANCCCFWYFIIASPWTEGNCGRTNAEIAGNLRSLFVHLIDANFFQILVLINDFFWLNSQDLALWISWERLIIYFN